MSTPDGIPMTSVTTQVMELAARLGLDPQVRDHYRGAVEIHLNGPEAESPFGVIMIGARSGRILRASIRHGNTGETKTYVGAIEVRRALRQLHSSPSA